MNRYTFMEMDGALAERLNEILLEMPKPANGSRIRPCKSLCILMQRQGRRLRRR